MLGFIRLVVVAFVALTVVYVCLSFYSRAVRRSKLRQKWHDGKQLVARDMFIQRGLERYDGSIRRKLILGVYVVPVVVVAVIIYLTNFA
jgi:Ca2+/Na+ antiporter